MSTFFIRLFKLTGCIMCTITDWNFTILSCTSALRKNKDMKIEITCFIGFHKFREWVQFFGLSQHLQKLEKHKVPRLHIFPAIPQGLTACFFIISCCDPFADIFGADRILQKPELPQALGAGKRRASTNCIRIQEKHEKHPGNFRKKHRKSHKNHILLFW